MRILFLFIFCLFLFSFKKKEDIIIWSKDHPLSWDDFKGKPEPRFAGASTHYLLKEYITEDNNKLEAHILACFFCKESWKRKRWVDNTMLRHEQKHFDIVELYARKLRKAIGGLSVKDQRSAIIKIDSLYAIYNNQMDVFQDVYDEKSDHSMDHDGQILWENNINAALDSLSDFQNTAIILKRIN